MSSSTRRNITLTPAADALLDNVGNASAYLTRLVEQHQRAWQEALRYLLAAGWTRPDILTAAAALNGHLVTLGIDLRDEVALALADLPRIDGVMAINGANLETWPARVADVRREQAIARAVLVLADEFWAGNGACARALDYTRP